LLASRLPIDVVRLFEFAPPGRSRVFLLHVSAILSPITDADAMFYVLSGVVGDVVEIAQFITEASQPEECFVYNTKLRVAHAEVGRRSIAVLAQL
jgi:hypothetical protein